MSARDLVESGYSDPQQKARFLAAASPHSGDWLSALPITACSLRLSDEAVRVAVALRLGCSICVPHSCRCRSLGLHGLVCKQAPSRINRRHALNDVVARAVQSPVTKEPVGLTRLDGRRPDSLTLIPWQEANLWLGTSPWSTLAASYLSSSALSASAAADLAASRKEAKYTSFTKSYIFQPIAVESYGAFSASALSFLTTLGERLTGTSSDLREMSYLFQRLSVIVQRFNSVLIHKSFVSADEEPDLAIPTFAFSFMFLALGIFTTEGVKK